MSQQKLYPTYHAKSHENQVLKLALKTARRAKRIDMGLAFIAGFTATALLFVG